MIDIYSDKILFASHGANDIEYGKWSQELYRNVAKNKFIISSKIPVKDAFPQIFCYAIQNNYQYIIYIDADCFVCSYKKLNELFKQFIGGGYVFAGMPDGHAPLRVHNYYLINPFFSFWNVSLFKDFDFSKKTTNILTKLDDVNLKELTDVVKDMNDNVKFKLDNFEIYYTLFSNIAMHVPGFKIKYFYAKLLPQIAPFCTGIFLNKDEQIPICVHSWFARKKDQNNKTRIQKIYNYAVNILTAENKNY